MKFKFAKNIVYRRRIGEVRFWCYCGEEIILYEDNMKECKCGRKYRLAQYVEIEDK